jgi:hypothetical protein
MDFLFDIALLAVAVLALFVLALFFIGFFSGLVFWVKAAVDERRNGNSN